MRILHLRYNKSTGWMENEHEQSFKRIGETSSKKTLKLCLVYEANVNRFLQKGSGYYWKLIDLINLINLKGAVIQRVGC